MFISRSYIVIIYFSTHSFVFSVSEDESRSIRNRINQDQSWIRQDQSTLGPNRIILQAFFSLCRQHCHNYETWKTWSIICNQNHSQHWCLWSGPVALVAGSAPVRQVAVARPAFLNANKSLPVSVAGCHSVGGWESAKCKVTNKVQLTRRWQAVRWNPLIYGKHGGTFQQSIAS